MKRRSFAGPVILIGIGGLFLLNNVYPGVSFGRLLADWWPALLILFGVIQAAEILGGYYADADRTAAARPIGFGTIVAIVIFGAVLSAVSHHVPHGVWGPIRANGVDIFGQEFDYPVTVDSDATGVKRVVLDSLRGNIVVNGTDTTNLHVDGHKILHAYDKASADRANGKATLNVSREGDILYLRGSDEDTAETPQLRVDLEIAVPKSVTVEARGREGDLAINTVTGGVDVTSQKGEVRLDQIKNGARLDVQHCGLVRATNVQGDLEVEGSGGDVQIEGVAGQVTVTGNFSGTLDFRNLTQPLHFESDKTDLKVAKLPGSINIDLGEMRAENVLGPVRIMTRSRDIHLDGFTGPLEIDLGRGDIELKPNPGTLAKIDVHSKDGNIQASLPTAGGFDLKAATKQGEVTNDYGSAIVAEQNGERAASLKMAAAVNDAPEVALTTDRGDIQVRKLN